MEIRKMKLGSEGLVVPIIGLGCMGMTGFQEGNMYGELLNAESFSKEVVTFGQYPGTGLSSIQYFIDNEIHHRAQLTVYLRALGIQPPFFWER